MNMFGGLGAGSLAAPVNNGRTPCSTHLNAKLTFMKSNFFVSNKEYNKVTSLSCL